MGQTTHINIEHIVVDSSRSYEQVKEALEARLGVAEDLDELGRQRESSGAAHALRSRKAGQQIYYAVCSEQICDAMTAFTNIYQTKELKEKE
jgi:hypothetical protein